VSINFRTARYCAALVAVATLVAHRPAARAECTADAKKLRIDPADFKGRLQFRYTRVQNDRRLNPTTDGFTLNRLRLGYERTLFGCIDLEVDVELKNDPSLKDGRLDFRPHPFATVTIGQFKVPFGMENFESRTRLLTLTRAELFERIENRDVGVMLSGERVLSGYLSYYVGAFNGNGPNNLTNDNDKLLVAAWLRAHPASWLDLGGYYSHNETTTTKLQSTNTHSVGGELRVTAGGFTLQAEAVYAFVQAVDDDNRFNRWGYYVLGAWRHKFAKWADLELVAKWEEFDPDDREVNRFDLQWLTGGLTYYLEDYKAKLMLNVIHKNEVERQSAGEFELKNTTGLAQLQLMW